MADIKKMALEKMLKEMQDKHSGAEDAIHNWLCDQGDEKLLRGILNQERTIKGAMQYCISQAEKIKSGNAAMVDDQTVFSWVRRYFVSDQIKVENVPAVVTTSTKPAAKTKNENRSRVTSAKPKEQEQLSLLDFL